MNRCRLYIADVDEQFVSSIRNTLVRRSDIELVGNSANGRAALMDILRLAPDVVLTDIPLPALDGIALLRELQRTRRPPSVIVCTRFYSQASINCACKYGAAFFLCKPIDLQALPGLIIECGHCAGADPVKKGTDGSNDSEGRRAEIVRALLKQLGISPKLNGSACIIEAAVHCRDELLLRNLSHGLYAELARRLDSSISRVERSLRNAIGIAYERGTLSNHFHSRPTNRQFIQYILRQVDEAEREAQ